MKILHAVYTPRLSGAEVLVAKLAREHLRAGIATAVVSLNAPETNFSSTLAEQQRDGIDWHCPATNPTSLRQRMQHLHQTLREYQPTVVFAHSVIPAAYLRVATRTPVWSVLHAAADNYNTPALTASEYVLRHLSAGVICVSELAGRCYQQKFGSRRPVRVISNGIDLQSFLSPPGRDTSLRQSLAMAQDARLLLQVGRITQVKNQATSVDALQHMVAAGLNTHLVLVGQTDDIDYLATLHQKAAAYGLQNRIHFLGGRTDIADLMHQADLILMPSEREAHSLAFLEAMASCKPLIGSDIASFAFARQIPGVTLFGAGGDGAALAQAVCRHAAIGWPDHFERDMKGHDIRTTARAYEAIAHG